MLSTKSLLPLCILLFSAQVIGQVKHIISGVVSDVKTNETLIGVTIKIDEKNQFISTNEYGFYSITLPEGS